MTNGGLRTFMIAAIFVLAGLVGDARAQNNIDFAKLEIQTVKLADDLYVLMGGPAQGNIVAVRRAATGMFLIDSMYPQMHQKIVDALSQAQPPADSICGQYPPSRRPHGRQ